MVGLTFASVWGFVFSRDGGRVVKEIIREGGFRNRDQFNDPGRDAREMLEDLQSDTTTWPEQSPDMQEMTDSLKALEGEQ